MCMDAFLNHIICHISTMCVVYDLMYLVSALFLEIFTFETKIFFFFFYVVCWLPYYSGTVRVMWPARVKFNLCSCLVPEAPVMQ